MKNIILITAVFFAVGITVWLYSVSIKPVETGSAPVNSHVVDTFSPEITSPEPESSAASQRAPAVEPPSLPEVIKKQKKPRNMPREAPVKARVIRGNQTVENFSDAKRRIRNIYGDHPQTFYCGCRYEGRTVEHESCGYAIRKNAKRANRIEWEHVVPAHRLGRKLLAWSEGHPDCRSSKGKAYRGRRCANRVSSVFRTRAADLYNLVPSVGEINGDRSNFRMGVIEGEAREYGRCDVEISHRTVEPREAIRGDVARIYLYMDWAYPDADILSSEDRRQFKDWNRSDPVDAWERERARRIAAIQGNQNPFVTGALR